MKFIRSKGISRTKITPDGIIRGIELTNDEKSAALKTDLVKLATEDPDLLVRQYISGLDKVYKKPEKLNKMSEDWFNSRDQLGKEVWLLLEARLEALKKEKDQIDKAKENWAWKLHPYLESESLDNDKKKMRNYGKAKAEFTGSKYKILAVDDDGNEKNAREIAQAIENHLFENEVASNGDAKKRTKEEKKVEKGYGLVQKRARSIEKSTLSSKRDIVVGEDAWTTEVKDLYFEFNDLAKEIYSECSNKGHRNEEKAYRQKIGEICSKHFKVVEPNNDTDELRRKQLYNLHNEIKKFYQDTCRKRKVMKNWNSFSKWLPRDKDALICRLRQQQENRKTNDLIRRGKIIYFSNVVGVSATTKPNNDPAKSKKQQMAEAKNHFWTSEGQSEIKRHEYFVRTWRGSMVHAAMTLRQWVDPKSEVYHDELNDDDTLKYRDQDVLSDKIIRKLTGDDFNLDRMNSKLELFFGEQERLFYSTDKEQQRELLYATLKIGAKLRNILFHPYKRSDLINALENSISCIKNQNGEKLSEATFGRIASLATADLERRAENWKKRLESIHLGKFADQIQFQRFVGTIQSNEESDIILPRFNRLVEKNDGLKNNLSRDDLRKNLPSKANSISMQNERLGCKYGATKLLYENGFANWLDQQNVNEISKWIDQVINEGTRRAKQTVRNTAFPGQIEAKTSVFRERWKDKNVNEIFADLQQEITTETRHQNLYEAEKETAKDNSKWVEGFKLDFLGIAFTRFLQKKEFTWLLTGNSTIQDPPTPVPEIEFQPENFEQWQENLYYFLHFVPVDDVSTLLNQIKKSAVLEKKSKNTDEGVKISGKEIHKVLSLYREMASDKFEGSTQKLGLYKDAYDLYRNHSDFNRVFKLDNDADQSENIPMLRGLRQLLRYGSLDKLKCVFHSCNIGPELVDRCLKIEHKRTPTKKSEIQLWQEEKTRLHKQLQNLKRAQVENEFSSLIRYEKVVTYISDHGLTADTIRLTTHIKAQKFIFRMLGKLIDYAGVWERDKIYVFLGLIEQQFTQGVPSDEAELKNYSELLTIKSKIKKLNSPAINEKLDWLTEENRTFFITRFGNEKEKTRNMLAHFTFLDKGKTLNITDLINETRILMDYDRKRKDKVSGTVKEFALKEGVELNWTMKNQKGVHNLASPQVQTSYILHLKDTVKRLNGVRRTPKDKHYSITTPRHSYEFLKMIKMALDG